MTIDFPSFRTPQRRAPQARPQGTEFWRGVWAAGQARRQAVERDMLSIRQPAPGPETRPLSRLEDNKEDQDASASGPDERPPTNPKFRPGFNLPARLKALDEMRKQFVGCKERKQFDWGELRTAVVGPTVPIVTNEAATMLGNHAARIATGIIGVGISRATGRPVITGWNVVPVQGQGLPTGPVERNLPSILTSLMGFGTFHAVFGGVKNTVEQLRHLRRDDLASPLQAAKYQHEDIVRATAQDRRALAPPVRAQVDRIDTEIRELTKLAHRRRPQPGMEGAHPMDDGPGAARVHHLLRRREAILCSDLQPKHLPSIVSDPRTKKALQAIADSYPPGPRKALMDFFKRIENQPRAAVYLYGEGGTGKTTTGNDIGKALDWPVLDYTLPQFLHPNFFGPKRDWTLEQPDAPLDDVAGYFFADLLQVGRNDVVVMVNEAIFGDDPNAPHVQELKIRMEKKVLEFINNAIPRKIRAIFIFNGNAPNTNQPLRERIPEIECYFEEPQKRKKADEALAQALAASEKNLPAAQHDRLGALCRDNMDFIVKCDVALGKGLRVIEDVVNNLHSRLAGELQEGRQPRPWQIRQDIVDDFKRMTSADEAVYARLLEESGSTQSTPRLRPSSSDGPASPFRL
jgi:hypothetical protein